MIGKTILKIALRHWIKTYTKNIKLMHSNDSLTDLNSHKDRHTHIGKGRIGLEGFEKLTDFAQKTTLI